MIPIAIFGLGLSLLNLVKRKKSPLPFPNLSKLNLKDQSVSNTEEFVNGRIFEQSEAF